MRNKPENIFTAIVPMYANAQMKAGLYCNHALHENHAIGFYTILDRAQKKSVLAKLENK